MKLWIVGAGGFGREVLMYAHNVIEQGAAEWTVGGFIDDNPDALGGRAMTEVVRGPIDTLQPDEGDRFLVGVGDPALKLALVRRIEARGGRFISVRHPTAWVGERSTVGEGCLLAPYSAVSCDSRVGNHVTILGNAGIGHDARVADGCTLSGYSEINGGVELEEGVFLGSHAVVVPRLKMGAYSKVMAGAIVMKDTPAGASVGGNPGRILPTL